MRWNKLFDDLETQLERELSAEEADLGVEEERLRLGRLGIRDRLIALHESSPMGEEDRVSLTLMTGERMALHPLTFGRDWLTARIVDDRPQPRQCLIPIAAISTITFGSGQAVRSLEPGVPSAAYPALSERLGFSFVLRDLCRRRHAVNLVTLAGSIHGTIDRVGRDHIDLAIHEAGSVRRQSAVTETRLVALSAVALVRL